MQLQVLTTQASIHTQGCSRPGRALFVYTFFVSLVQIQCTSFVAKFIFQNINMLPMK